MRKTTHQELMELEEKEPRGDLCCCSYSAKDFRKLLVCGCYLRNEYSQVAATVYAVAVHHMAFVAPQLWSESG